MSTSLPIPITFRLPDGWSAVDPDVAGAPQAAFVAIRLRDGDSSGFTPNITIAAQPMRPESSLAEVAEAAVGHVRTGDAAVSVTHRAEFGSDTAPGLTQQLHMTTMAGGLRRDLVQMHFFVTLRDAADAAKQAVLKIVLTSTEDQAPEAVRGFEQFLATVRAARRNRDVVPPYRRVSAETLRLATEATGAPEYLRGLARVVRSGQATWAQIADGMADDLPEVQAVNAVVAAEVRELTEPAGGTKPEQSDWNDEWAAAGNVFRTSR